MRLLGEWFGKKNGNIRKGTAQHLLRVDKHFFSIILLYSNDLKIIYAKLFNCRLDDRVATVSFILNRWKVHAEPLNHRPICALIRDLFASISHLQIVRDLRGPTIVTKMKFIVITNIHVIDLIAVRTVHHPSVSKYLTVLQAIQIVFNQLVSFFVKVINANHWISRAMQLKSIKLLGEREIISNQ